MHSRLLFSIVLPAALLGQAGGAPQESADLNKQIAQMAAVIQRLEHRVDELEAKLANVAPSPGAILQGTTAAVQPALPASERAVPSAPAESNFLRGTSLNVLLDGYYGYNFNQPIGRVNRLRAYDVASNAFSLNQAAVVVENAPNPAEGKRWGVRLDLQFGQATETLQGNVANEPRPEVYRNIFQAYGTYVAPIGNGLTIDFGKWASSLGIENNFTQDQLNYSRSFWFDFLPFYHMGARFSYPLTKTLTANYWITNGTQQTEPFKDFKDQFGGLTFQPSDKLSWSVNYYFGQEHPDVLFLPNSTTPGLPTQQGVPFLPIAHAPKGKLHIIDSYATWQATPKLTLAAEGDYVIERLQTNSAPQRTWGGAGYARYQLSPRVAVAGRAEYLADQGGLFTGRTQALKETTITFEQRVVQGFLLRQEWRRDFSNQAYFFTNMLDRLKREQNTATIGVVWWFGAKKSPW
jgi:putative OmpL-like beta-barrel porin-2